MHENNTMDVQSKDKSNQRNDELIETRDIDSNEDVAIKTHVDIKLEVEIKQEMDESDSLMAIQDSSRMKTCCVRGCKNELKDISIKFFPLPKNPIRLKYWLRLIYRENWQYKSNAELQKYRICADHFHPSHISGDGQIYNYANPIENIQKPDDKTMHENNTMDVQSDDESEQSETEETLAERIETRNIDLNEDVATKTQVDIKREVEIKQEIDESDTLIAMQGSLEGYTTTKQTQSVCVQTVGYYLAHHKQKITLLTKSLRKCLNENARLKQIINDSAPYKQLVKLRGRFQACKQDNTRLQKKIQKDIFCTSFVEKLLSFVEGDKIESNYGIIKKRYSPEYIKFALNLFLCNHMAYKYVSSYFYLPNIRTLYHIMAEIPSGIIAEHFETLELAVEQMKPLEKICNVCVDYMPIRPGIEIDKLKQKKAFYGRHEIDGVVKDLPAKYAVVVAVTGVAVRWRQVLGYALTADCQHYPELITWIEHVITKLIEIQLDVRCLVTDTSSFFWTGVVNKELSVNKTHFEIGGKKILYIFDVPHLIRSARNILMKNDLKFLDGKVAKWSVVRDVYEKRRTHLTMKHVSPSGRAKTTAFAAQTFSLRVAKVVESLITQNILGPEAKDTAELLVRFNNIFDILNSRQSKRTDEYTAAFKQPYCGSSKQKDFFEEAMIFLESLKIKNASARRIRTERIVKGFMMTIRSVMVLYEDLEEVDILWTRNLNLDLIEILFKHIKQIPPRTIGLIGARKFTRGLLKFSLTDSHKLLGNSETENEPSEMGVSGVCKQEK